MSKRLRSTWFAGSGAILLVLSLSGAVLGASVLTMATGPTPETEFDPLVVDTSATFEDLDGNGVDDDCQDAAVADPAAAEAAEAAVDLDGDGTISVPEAAQSDRTGGKNCNHGGYVSQVATAQCDEGDEADEPTGATDDGSGEQPVGVLAVVEPTEDDAAEACEDEEAADDEEPSDDTPVVECVEVAAPVFDPTTMTGPGAFGAYVSSVAASDAMGGKNCNHGGAVSEAVKAAKELAREARDAAKAEREAERDAAKAERKAQRDAAKAERRAAQAAEKAQKGSQAGKGKQKGD